MKICIFGENITRASGFANQTKILCDAFVNAGIETELYSAFGVSNTEQKFKEYPVRYTDYGMVSKLISQNKPDVYIMFGPIGAHTGADEAANSYFFNEVNKVVRPYVWLAWESIYAQPDFGIKLKSLGKNRVVHLSEYARGIWTNYCSNEQPIIPHAVDLSYFKPLNAKTELRRKYTQKFKQYIDPNAFILVSVDRNDHRKRHDLTFDMLDRVIKQGYNVQLIMHCQKEAAYNFKNLIMLYEAQGLPRGSVILTDFDYVAGLSVEELNELYNLSDARICSSGGEGFGIPSIECLAAGCLNIVPNNTTFPEIIENNGLLIDTCNRNANLFPDAIFSEINVEDGVEKIIWAINNKNIVSEITARGMQSIAGKYDKETIQKKWVDLVLRNESNEDVTYHYTYGIGQEQREREQLKDSGRIIRATLFGDYLVDIGTKRGIIPHTVNLAGGTAFGYEKDENYEVFASESAKIFCQWGGELKCDYDNFSFSFINSLETMKDYEIEQYIKLQPNKIYFKVNSNPLQPGKNHINLKSERTWIKFFKDRGYNLSKCNEEIKRKFTTLGLIVLIKDGLLDPKFSIEDINNLPIPKM